MKKTLSITLSSITMDHPIAITNGHTSHVTPMAIFKRDMLITDERSAV
jgi:hypothetical protein